MKNINVNVQRPPTNIPLGRQGENLATCIIFDCTGLVQLYGDGTAELLHELKDGTVYPVAVTQDGASVSWTVSASDTATVGAGRAELRWYVGDTLAKSAKFRTSVSSALADSTTETPPEPQQSWVDAVLQAAQEIKDGAISDEKLAEAIAAYLEEHPIDAGLDEAELAAYLTENGYLTDAALADAVAQALAEAKASGEFDGAPGKDGADGSPGADGADGVGIQSVVQTTTSAEDGGTNVITVTKTDGSTSTFEVRNGSKGSDGEPGADGKDGQPGADGVTPNIQIGTVETLTAGSDATASITGTPENPLLNLGIPKGADGTSGKSAYQYAKDGGYTGTEAEFAAKMAEEMPDALPNPNAITFTGAVTGSYDGSDALTVEIPSGGGSAGGSGKAKSKILINQEITELTASLSVTLDHDFHKLTAIINSSSSGAALTADSDGTAVASRIGLIIDSTAFSYNSRKVAYTDTNSATWQSRMIGAEWSDDLSVFKRGFKVDVVTGSAGKYYDFPFGGISAMYGTLGTDDNSPRAGKTANIVVNGAYLNVGTRVILWGEYYE